MSSSYLFLGTKTFAPPVCLFGFQGLSAELDQIYQKKLCQNLTKAGTKMGNGCSTVGKKVALYTINPQFESSHCNFTIYFILTSW